MAFSTSFVFLLAGLSTQLANAANDWSQPCLSGVCSYDLPASSTNPASGTVQIWGSSSAISDVTPAAGWEILDCSPTSASQDIRLVCTDTTPNANATCGHLYADYGAVGKIVRLPQNCGPNPFARISNSWIPADQSIPRSLTKRVNSRAQPQVKALSIDTNFGAVDTSKTGPVRFNVQGANVPGAAVGSGESGIGRRTMRFGFGVPGGGAVKPRGLFSDIGKAVTALSNLNTFSTNKTTLLAPLNINQSFPVISASISCPPLTATVKAQVDANVNAYASVGVVASGTVVPPVVEDFALVSSLNANIDSTVHFNADVSGTLDSGKILLFEVGVPGLDFPGILTIGPSLQINAEAKATLDLGVAMSVGIKYNVSNAQLVFPPPSQAVDNANAFNINDTPLTLALTPQSIKATGTIEAHLIPSLNLGIQALGDIVNSGVFMQLDASAVGSLTAEEDLGVTTSGNMNVTGSTASVVKPRGATMPGYYYWHPPATDAEIVTQPSKASSVVSVASSTTTSPSSSASASHNSTSLHTSSTANSSTSVNTLSSSSSFGGCFELDANLDVSAGADADFFKVFDASAKVDLFNHKFVLLKKCFGNQGSSSVQRDLRAPPPPPGRLFEKRSFVRRAAALPATTNTTGPSTDNKGLSCLSANVGAATTVPVLGQTVSVSGIVKL